MRGMEHLASRSLENLHLNQVFIVFGCPIQTPTTREFLGAYSTEKAAQAFIDAQPSEAIREQLSIWQVPLDRPFAADCPEDWVDPAGLAAGYGSAALGQSSERDRRALGPTDWTPQDLVLLKGSRMPEGYEHMNAELEGWEP
jgi:hypothetical protein